MEDTYNFQLNKIKTKFKRTGILISTRISRLSEITTTTQAIIYLKESVASRGISSIIIDESIVLLGVENWNQKIITVPRQLLSFNDEVSYKMIVRRRYVKYHLCEALIRMSELIKIGKVDFPNNNSILIHLAHKKELYPCILACTHYKSGKFELRVVQMYNQRLFFCGSSFLT